MRNLTLRAALLVTVGALGITAAPAFAQDAAPAGDTNAEEATGNDIVVTARKRTETLQDIPSSSSLVRRRAFR